MLTKIDIGALYANGAARINRPYQDLNIGGLRTC